MRSNSVVSMRVLFLWAVILLFFTTLFLPFGSNAVAAAPASGDSYGADNPAPDQRALESTSSYSISRCGNTGSKVLLTYDDWSYDAPTRIVDQAKALKAKGVGGMFFPIRKNYIDYLNATGVNLPYLVRDQSQYNGNHTWSHLNLTKYSSSTIQYQIANGAGGSTGTSGYLRPPYGAYNTTVKTIAESMNYHICTWTLDTRDWEGSKSATTICNYVKTYAQAGSVVLMHLQTNSYYATNCIIDGLRAKGLSLCQPYKVSGVYRHTPIRAPYPLPC